MNYNNNIKNVNNNVQIQIFYSINIYARKYWWNFFKSLLLKATVNFYILFKLINKKIDKKTLIIHKNWIQKFFNHLIKISTNKLNVFLHFLTFFENLKFLIDSLEHHKIRLNKKQYCISCTKNDRKAFKIDRRIIFDEILNNEVMRVKQRFSRIWTKYAIKACENKIVCKALKCWNQLYEKTKP